MNAYLFHGRRGAALAALCLAAGWMLLAPAAPRSAVQWFDDLCSSVGRPMFASAPAPAGAGARPATIVKRLSCEPLPNAPGKSVTTVSVEFPPLAYSPAHRHPGSVTAVVIEGTIRSQLQGTPARTTRPARPSSSRRARCMCSPRTRTRAHGEAARLLRHRRELRAAGGLRVALNPP